MRATTAGRLGAAALFAGLLLPGAAAADQVRIRIELVTPEGIAATIGTVRATDGAQGVTLTPLLKSLAPGPHALGIYEHGECGPGTIDGKRVAGGAAGGSFVPEATVLPGAAAAQHHAVQALVLTVDKDGIARAPVTVRDVKLMALPGRALVIAASDGGERQACGVIP
ncbi:MAG: superoxide dismutase family protein [Alphaproteobacteria bacterium]